MGAPPWGKLGAGVGGPLAGSVTLLPGSQFLLLHPKADLRADTDPVHASECGGCAHALIRGAVVRFSGLAHFEVSSPFAPRLFDSKSLCKKSGLS